MQDLGLIRDIVRHGNLEVLDLSHTSVPIGDRLRKALLVAPGLAVRRRSTLPGRGVDRIVVEPTAGARLKLKELSLSGTRCDCVSNMFRFLDLPRKKICLCSCQRLSMICNPQNELLSQLTTQLLSKRSYYHITVRRDSASL